MILSTQRNQSGSKRKENEALIRATMQQIADAAGLPKANLHYYFPTKEILYRNVIDKIFNLWLEAADIFDAAEGPKDGLSSYIDAKLESSRHFPNGSKVWANEVIQGAPIIQDYLESKLTAWTHSKAEIIERLDGSNKPQDTAIFYLERHATLRRLPASNTHFKQQLRFNRSSVE